MIDKSQLSLDEPLEIWGSGFRPNESIVFQLLIDESLQPIIGGRLGAQVTADATGAFAVRLEAIGGEGSVRDRAPGVRTILAQGSAGSVASVPVKILLRPIETTSPSSSLSAKPIGFIDETTIWGAGFKRNEAVTILLLADSSEQDRIIAGGQANAFGAFQIDVDITLDAGIYTLRAVGDRGSEATAPLLVTTK